MKIYNPYLQVSLASKPKLYKNRLEGPILPFVITAVTNCINHRYLLNFFYEGSLEAAPGYRWAEVYVYGRSKFTLNHLIRAYQYKGTTESIVEEWKTFRMDRIRSTAVLTTKTFNKPRPLYNDEGDGLMGSIILQVNFDDIQA